jgi:hypothetical protein
MVEFALVLPLLLLLLCGALDFGRVFFAWVQLANAARVGANYAASNPDAWGTPGNPALQLVYAGAIANDSTGINCTPPLTPAPPTFPLGRGIGAEARVQLECKFDLITPFMESFFGADYTIRAESTFPIRSGCVGCPPAATPTPLPTPSPTPSPAPCGIVPDLHDLTVAAARSAWSNNGFTGGFLPSNAINSDIVDAQTTHPGSIPGDCIALTARVTVTTHPPPTPPTCANVPDMFGMTVASARTAWTSAGFTGSFTPPGGSNSDTVLSQTTTPSAAPEQCVAFSTRVTVTHGPAPTPVPTPTPAPCIVPSFIGTISTNAQGTWTTAGFATQVKFNKPGQLPYTIQSQTLVGGSVVPCSGNITLGPTP